MTVRYAPGSWRVVVTPRGLVVLEEGVAPELLARIWEQVAAGRGFAAVLEALAGAFGTSLAGIPPFAVALAEDDAVRLAVRGAFTIAVETAGGAEEVSGAGVTTWTERVVPGALRVSVRRPGAGAALLPVRDGVIAAEALEWEPTDAAPAVSSPGALERAGAVPSRPDPEPEPSTEASAPWSSREERSEDGPHLDASEAAPSDPPPAARGPWSSLSSAVPDPSSVLEPAPSSDPTPAPDPAPASPGGLIGSVPTLASADTWLPPESTIAPPAEPAGSVDPLDATTGYDHLFGATVVRSVEEAAVRIEEGGDDAPTGSETGDAGSATDGPGHAEGDVLGDHDGATISAAQARALRENLASGLTDSGPPPLAPPRAPAPGRIRLSTGQEFALDRTVVIGRRPRSTRVSGTDLPHLVAVDSPEQDISRSHLELRVEGDAILATDLHTTNGTTLRRPGSEPVRLHPGEQTVVVAGDLLDLGDGIEVTIEEVP
ncbi:FHA domain-containing protein [Microbacterium sp. CJ88]|uniref:FHA domain-containing protein n=1 Tax=Microbacterium sp. CJ88 TaxID=3445672 RepID=UPI003F6590DD